MLQIPSSLLKLGHKDGVFNLNQTWQKNKIESNKFFSVNNIISLWQKIWMDCSIFDVFHVESGIFSNETNLVESKDN